MASSPTPRDDAHAWPDDAVEVGRIAGGWGVHGGLRVHPHSSTPQALLSARRWYLQPPEASLTELRSLPAALDVVSVRRHGGAVVAQVHGVADRNAADGLRGARVFVPRSAFPPPQAGEWYWVDLIGLDVSNREGRSLGRVAGLIDIGPHAVLQVAAPGAETRERLIPFVDAYVDEVDLAARQVRVDWSADD
jgi:16S rRNA processing protein RimM